MLEPPSSERKGGGSGTDDWAEDALKRLKVREQCL